MRSMYLKGCFDLCICWSFFGNALLVAGRKRLPELARESKMAFELLLDGKTDLFSRENYLGLTIRSSELTEQ